MSKVLIIGAGGVGGVVTHKCAQARGVITAITLASRTESKCRAIAEQIDFPVATARVNADNVPELIELIKRERDALVSFLKQYPFENVYPTCANFVLVRLAAKQALFDALKLNPAIDRHGNYQIRMKLPGCTNRHQIYRRAF